MAAVMGPGDGNPPTARPVRRRRWLAGLVVVWTVLLLGGVFWSARTDEATVPEQRDIGHAVAELRRATGALVAAAEDDRWVLRLGDLRVEECSLNPAWTGRRAGRELTLYVPEGEARAALDGIVAGLPEAYRAGLVAAHGGTQLSLFADAGGYIAIESEARSTDQVLSVRLDSGCRPPAETVDQADPAAGAAPEILAGTLAALGAGDTGATEVRAVTCPAGETAATFQAEARAAPDPDGAVDRDETPLGLPDGTPRGLPDGTTPVWAEPDGWAYRNGSASVVVTAEGDRLLVSVTTGCRAG